MSDNLFSSANEKDMIDSKPLADRLRPTKLEEVVGQDHLLTGNGLIGQMVKSGKLKSCIFWGPAGCGKTTVARMLANYFDVEFESLSAVFSGINDVRKVFAKAGESAKFGKKTLLFIDEIHRFNKAQQDGLLPFVEDGTVVLVGATTENPSFELNSALLSRTQVCVFKRLEKEDLSDLLKRSCEIVGHDLLLSDEGKEKLYKMADGDGRYFLNLLDILFSVIKEGEKIDDKKLVELLANRSAVYDKKGEGHYNLISALHKSLRGSDVNASLYWFARMLHSGEDPLYIIRRLTRFAYEDIGLADPEALKYALAVWDSFKRIGSPEGELAISQLVIYLANAPKSNAGYEAFNKAMALAGQTGSLMPPKNILNAPTNMMKDLGYGEGYTYGDDTEKGFSVENFWPDAMNEVDLYKPYERGFEREMRKRMNYWKEFRNKKKQD